MTSHLSPHWPTWRHDDLCPLIDNRTLLAVFRCSSLRLFSVSAPSNLLSISSVWSGRSLENISTPAAPLKPSSHCAPSRRGKNSLFYSHSQISERRQNIWTLCCEQDKSFYPSATLACWEHKKPRSKRENYSRWTSEQDSPAPLFSMWGARTGFW